MKQKFTILLAAVFTLLVINSADSNATNLGVLDIEKVAKDAKAVSDIQSKVSKKQEEYQKSINKKQTDLEAEQKKLEAKKNLLTKEAFEKEQVAFAKKIDELKEFVDKRQASLKKASTSGMEKVNEEMKDIVAAIAKEKQLDAIVPSSQVVYAIDSMDITDEVVKRLNKKVTKVSVSFE